MREPAVVDAALRPVNRPCGSDARAGPRFFPAGLTFSGCALSLRACPGRRDGRIGGDGRWQPQAKGPLCAALEGFSLHANTWVAPRDRDRLEALCRYAARPAVSESRLAELPDGRIGYALKRRFADGTTAVGMTNAVLMERLCALVPPAAQAPGDLPRRAGAGVGSAAEGGAAADGGG
ncbi:MAG: transposase [Planctomycetota bacterium]